VTQPAPVTPPAPAASVAADPCPSAVASPSSDLVAARDGTLCLLNLERAANHLGPLAANAALATAAQRYSRLMVHRRFFAHVSPGGSTLSSRQHSSGYVLGAHRWLLGEDLAWGSENRAAPAAIVASWMASPEHRANILAPGFKDVGIGIAAGSPTRSGHPSAATYTAEFGARS